VSARLNPLFGDIWQADLDPTVGHEQAGVRPVVVVSVDPFNETISRLVIVVPVTRTYRHPFNVLILPQVGGVRFRSFAMCEMIRSISIERLHYRIGEIDERAMEEIADRFRVLLGLP
jgi:mRNA interferase MazF